MTLILNINLKLTHVHHADEKTRDFDFIIHIAACFSFFPSDSVALASAQIASREQLLRTH